MVAALRDRAGDPRFLSVLQLPARPTPRSRPPRRGACPSGRGDGTRGRRAIVQNPGLGGHAHAVPAPAAVPRKLRQPRTALELLGRARRRPPPRAARAPGGVAARGGELHVQGALGRARVRIRARAKVVGSEDRGGSRGHTGPRRCREGRGDARRVERGGLGFLVACATKTWPETTRRRSVEGARWSQEGGVFTAPAVAHRRAMDAFVAAEIQRHSRASGPAANGPATNASIAGVAGNERNAARVGGHRRGRRAEDVRREDEAEAPAGRREQAPNFINLGRARGLARYLSFFVLLPSTSLSPPRPRALPGHVSLKNVPSSTPASPSVSRL